MRFLDIFVRFAYNEDAEEHTIHHEGGAYYDRNRNRVQDEPRQISEMAMRQDIFITKNGKNIARLTSPTVNKLAVLDSLVGIVPKDSAMDEETIREERLARQ